jgi:hypothetical protein
MILAYKGFEIRKMKAGVWKIYLNDEFKSTCSSKKNAKRQIDFLTGCGVWQ